MRKVHNLDLRMGIPGSGCGELEEISAEHIGDAVRKVVTHWLQTDHQTWLQAGVAMPGIRAELAIWQKSASWGPGIIVTASIAADEDGGDDGGL